MGAAQDFTDQQVARALGRRSDVAPFLAMDVIADARRQEALGRSIIHLEVGEPGAPAPRPAREAARCLLEGQPIGYTQALGLPSLRARIARHYAQTYAIDVDPERIAVTTGSSAGFVLAFLALFEEGARIAIARPGYPPYRNILSALGYRAVGVPAGATEGFRLRAEALRVADALAPLQGVLAMGPGNPTGTALPGPDLAALAGFCAERGLPLISDEIYHGLSYGAPAETALRFSEQAIIINSFSKYFCMTGWRIGWMVLPGAMVRTVERLAQNLFISPPLLSQVAAQAAFDGQDETEAYRAQCGRNRDRLAQALPRLGLPIAAPMDGAFYAYCDMSAHGTDSLAFCRRLLDQAGIAATSGIDFDPEDGHRYVRFSYAGSEADIAEAVHRLERVLA